MRCGEWRVQLNVGDVLPREGARASVTCGVAAKRDVAGASIGIGKIGKHENGAIGRTQVRIALIVAVRDAASKIGQEIVREVGRPLTLQRCEMSASSVR